MTQKLKSIIVLFMSLFAANGIHASCPLNYTTASVNLSGVIFSVCYPSEVSLSLNSGYFNIYISITNTTGSTSNELDFRSFLPAPAGLNTVISNGCPPTVPASACDGTSVVGGGNGKGQLIYISGLGAGVTTKLTATMQATAAGTYTYFPLAIVQGGGGTANLTVTITVENSCPIITSSNFSGPSGCGSVGGHSNAGTTGNLNPLVSGGATPYLFTTQAPVDGTVSVSASGIYSFVPNVTGPAVGSFNYFATDVAGCTSNISSVSVPINQSPILPDTSPSLGFGSNFLYVIAPGVPFTQSTNVTGGTPPYTYSVVGTPVNGNVTFNNVANTFTFTQTVSPGASSFQYSVTDANGCQALDPFFGRPVSTISLVSCQPGYTAAAALDTNQTVIYSVCYPTHVFVGQDFTETFSITNLNTGTRTPEFIADGIPDPNQNSASGLNFISNTPPPAGTTFTPTGSVDFLGGMGLFDGGTGGIPGSTSFTVIATLQAVLAGSKIWTGSVGGNPVESITFIMQVDPCPTITASNTAITGCNNFVTGDLSGLVTGGTTPYSFMQTGTVSCGSVTISPSGIFNYTAPVGFTGPCTFDYVATDTNSCPSNTGIVTVTANLGPIATDGLTFTCENQPIIGGILFVSGGTPPYNIVIITNGTFGTAVITDPVNGIFNYTPDPNAFGSDSFTFQVTDAAGCMSNIASESIDILQAPVAATTGIDACVNGTATGSLTGLVSAGVPPYTFGPTGAAVGGTVTVDPSGIYTFTGDPGFSGAGSFEFQVTDSEGCVGTGVVDVTIASPIAGNTAVNSCVNGFVTGDLSGLVTGGFPGYTFTTTGSVPCGNVTIDIETGEFTFTPNTGFSGPCPFTYQVTDTQGCIATGEVDVTVSSPIANNATGNVCFNGATTGNLSTLVSSGFPPYSFTGDGVPVGGIVTINPSGPYSFTAASGFRGTGSFGYQVTDSNSCTATGNIALIIGALIANNTGLGVCVNTGLTGNLAPLVTDGVPPLTFAPFAAPVGGSVMISPSGIFTFSPTTNFSGVGGFDYQVTDGIACTATAAVGVTVLSPIVTGLNLIDCASTIVTGSLSGLASSGFPPYTFSATGPSVGGVPTVQANGSFSFTPNTGFNGLGGFVFAVTDTKNCFGTGAVNIAIGSPTATITGVSTCNDTFASNLNSFVTGGSGPYGFTGPIGAVSCAGASVTIGSTGNFSYTAPAGFTGPCSFIYNVTDANGCNANLSLTVNANVSPIAQDAAYSACQNVPISQTLQVIGGVPPLTFSIVTQPTHGTITSFNPATGAFTYTPNVGYVGPDSFQFQVTDSSVLVCTSNIGTIALTINNCCTPITDPFFALVVSEFNDNIPV